MNPGKWDEKGCCSGLNTPYCVRHASDSNNKVTILRPTRRWRRRTRFREEMRYFSNQINFPHKGLYNLQDYTSQKLHQLTNTSKTRRNYVPRNFTMWHIQSHDVINFFLISLIHDVINFFQGLRKGRKKANGIARR